MSFFGSRGSFIREHSIDSVKGKGERRGIFSHSVNISASLNEELGNIGATVPRCKTKGCGLEVHIFCFDISTT